MYLVKVVENETRSDPPDESPLLLSAAARVRDKLINMLVFFCYILISLFKKNIYIFYVALSETVWAPLDLPALVTENIHNPPDRIFWKAVLLLPSDHESVASLADR